MTSPDDHPFDRSTDPSRAPFSGKVSLDHGIASLGMGLLVGARFPLLALLLGVSAAQALRPLFYGVCLAAGLVIGATGLSVAEWAVGQDGLADPGRRPSGPPRDSRGPSRASRDDGYEVVARSQPQNTYCPAWVAARGTHTISDRGLTRTDIRPPSPSGSPSASLGWGGSATTSTAAAL